MPGPKPKTTSRKAAPQSSSSTRPTPEKKAGLHKRAARDVPAPPARRIERSLHEGKTQSLQAFRISINWS